MKKTIIVTAIILSLIITGSVTSFVYTKNMVESFSEELRRAGSDYSEIGKIRSQWDNKKTILMLFMNHRDIEEVSVSLLRAEAEAKEGREGAALQEIELAVFLMEELVERERLSAENIF